MNTFKPFEQATGRLSGFPDCSEKLDLLSEEAVLAEFDIKEGELCKE